MSPGAHSLTARRGGYLAKNDYVRDSLYSGHELRAHPRHYATAQISYIHPRGLSLTPSREIAPTGYCV